MNDARDMKKPSVWQQTAKKLPLVFLS